MSESQGADIVPVKQLRLSDAVAAQLEHLITSNQFGSDGRLPAERVLAEQFAVGRGTMREAIRKLEALGIIVKSHGVGTFAVANGDRRDRHMDLLTAGDVTALELFEVRYALEPLSAAMSAHRRTSNDLRELRGVLDRAVREGVSDAEFVALDFEFHRRIAQAAKSRLMAQMYEHIEKHHGTYSAKVIALPHRRDRAHAGHLRILDAVFNRNTAEARREALAHLRFAEKDLVSAVEESDKTDNR
jgi:GntR family transcriptional regulator, transcriptional repressor for pyruvate dehydrogenase complex